MADAKISGGDMQVMPDDVLGIASGQYGAMSVGYGWASSSGSGTGGAGGAGSGIVSINNDMTPAQILAGGAGVSVVSSGPGAHTIAVTTAVPNFIDNELVSGSGTNWVLVHLPNPAASLLVFQQLTGFGRVLLTPGTDYSVSGAAITTVNSLPAGALTASYRF
jgi:hypothetical protein